MALRIPDADYAAAIVMELDASERKLLLRALVEDYCSSPRLNNLDEWKADMLEMTDALQNMVLAALRKGLIQ